MKVMAIDFGDARTGIAISDPTGLLAGYTTVIHSRDPAHVAQEAARLAKAHCAERVVVGWAKNMDGSEGPRAERCREFAALVAAAVGMEPVLWDERRTTVDAHRILSETGNFRKNARKKWTQWPLRLS